jgi:tRNA(fMet)-specific endonuclease VapC
MLFLDTNVVVDLMRNRKPKLRDRYVTVRSAGGLLAVSTVVLFELRFGAANSGRVEQNMRALNAFLDDAMSIIAFDEAAASEAGSIRAELSRAGALIGPYDILIAAQARARSATLVTANTREFARVPGLIVTDWAA